MTETPQAMDKSATEMHIGTAPPQSNKSTTNFSAQTPSYSSPDKAASLSIKKSRTGWPESAEDLRVDRVRRRIGDTKKDHALHRCSECSYATKRRTNLQRHRQAMHSRDKQLECCGHLFSSKSELRRHVRHQHDSGYTCPQCGRLFCRKALLKRHMSVHNGVKEFTCQICNYASSHKSNLERHQRVHSKYKPNTETLLTEFPVSKTLTRESDCVSGPEMKVNAIMTQLNSLYHGTAERVQEKFQLDGCSSVGITNLNPKRMYANPYKCLLCNKRWQCQEELRKHERAFHPDLEVRALLSMPMKRVLQVMRRAEGKWNMVTSLIHTPP